MASSSYNIPGNNHTLSAMRRVNDAVYEIYRPVSGSIELEIVFFHGYQAGDCQNAFVETWMLADGSACWLDTLLPDKFPHSRIMTVSYDSSIERGTRMGRMDMYLVGEYLARSIIELAGIGQTCPVVFVGYCVGGLVLKEVCCRGEQLGACWDKAGLNPYHSFLRRMRGAFLFSTSQMGSRIQESSIARLEGPLLTYYKLLNEHSARLNSDFFKLRERFKWKTSGVMGANETEIVKTVFCKRDIVPFSLLTEEGSARIDMDEFTVLPGEDHLTITKPSDESSSNFQFLKKFLEGIQDEEWTPDKWQYVFNLPGKHRSMPHRLEKVLRTLQLGQSEPSKVCLVGMDGIGKTTLVKDVMMEIRTQFDLVGFVENTTRGLQQHELDTLVSRKLYYANGSKVPVLENGAGSLWWIFKGKKVLLFLDDVDSEHVHKIDSWWISGRAKQGSRLIITSCVWYDISSFIMHEVDFMSRDESKILFVNHIDSVVLQQIPDELVDQVVMKCDGLPLTLEVIGSYLCLQRDIHVWNEALRRLRNAESLHGDANDKLWAKLQVSFDKLAPKEQVLFLDLAVFDRWEFPKFRYDISIWRVMGDAVAWKNLFDKCLIRNTRSDIWHLPIARECIYVYIHEQLRDMGKSISRRYCRDSWQQDDVDKLFTQNQEMEEQVEMMRLQTLSMTWDRLAISQSRKRYSWRSIGQLPNLRLVRMSNVEMYEDTSMRFPSSIRLLHMISCSRREPYNRFNPFGFFRSATWPIREEDATSLRNMRVLVLENCSAIQMPKNFHELINLRVLIINNSGEHLGIIPAQFRFPQLLQILILSGIDMSHFPDNLHELHDLQTFTLSHCPNFRNFQAWQVPTSISFGQLPSLVCLDIRDCPSLSSLPESFGQLPSLAWLDIRACPSLSSLPESFGQLRSLACLDIRACPSLSSLPESFRQLRSLAWLDIRDCPSLSSLPESFGQLRSLAWLDIRDCPSLSSLPESFGQLRSLTWLDIADCPSLSSLPESFGQLQSLVSLSIRACPSLSSLRENFGQLQSLKSLYIGACPSLSSLSENFGQLQSLKSLHIGACPSLSSLPESFGQLQSLVGLFIGACPSLSSLPESLFIGACPSLSSLPESFRQLQSLDFLYIGACPSLSSLHESFGQLQSLDGQLPVAIARFLGHHGTFPFVVPRELILAVVARLLSS